MQCALASNLQASLYPGHESRLEFLVFSSTFDMVDHIDLLFKLKSAAVGCLVLNIISEFLTDRKQRGDGIITDFSLSRYGAHMSGL